MNKTFLIIVFALLGMAQAVAQEYEYVPFVREGVKWVCEYWDHPDGWGMLEPFNFTLEMKGDSVIDGKTYKAMHRYGGEAINTENDTIIAYLREENKVVYGIVPDGKVYSFSPLGIELDTVLQKEVKRGHEIVLFDFASPADFITNKLRWFIEGDEVQFRNVIPEEAEIAGKKVHRYIFDACNCLIEGIGFDGLLYGYPLSALCTTHLKYVIENGEVIYRSERLKKRDESDEMLPIVREDVTWVNEQVIVQNGDTTRSYYKYRFYDDDRTDPRIGCYRFTIDGQSGVEHSNRVAIINYSLSNLDNIFSNQQLAAVRKSGLDLLYFSDGSLYSFSRSNSDIDSDYTPNFYIFQQKEQFLSRQNLIEISPIYIEGVQCDRYAYIGEDGDTLAYVVEGIGFDSRDMGDLLTPFTRRPDPTADYQEWCGLSHVVKDGQIIYKGMRYTPGVRVGIDEVVEDKVSRPQDPRYYDLMGRPVGTEVPEAPGIYIHQGKKIIVR